MGLPLPPADQPLQFPADQPPLSTSIQLPQTAIQSPNSYPAPTVNSHPPANQPQQTAVQSPQSYPAPAVNSHSPANQPQQTAVKSPQSYPAPTVNSHPPAHQPQQTAVQLPQSYPAPAVNSHSPANQPQQTAVQSPQSYPAPTVNSPPPANQPQQTAVQSPQSYPAPTPQQTAVQSPQSYPAPAVNSHSPANQPQQTAVQSPQSYPAPAVNSHSPANQPQQTVDMLPPPPPPVNQQTWQDSSWPQASGSYVYPAYEEPSASPCSQQNSFLGSMDMFNSGTSMTMTSTPANTNDCQPHLTRYSSDTLHPLLTYAELKQENEALKEEVDYLHRELAKQKAKPSNLGLPIPCTHGNVKFLEGILDSCRKSVGENSSASKKLFEEDGMECGLDETASQDASYTSEVGQPSVDDAPWKRQTTSAGHPKLLDGHDVYITKHQLQSFKQQKTQRQTVARLLDIFFLKKVLGSSVALGKRGGKTSLPSDVTQAIYAYILDGQSSKDYTGAPMTRVEVTKKINSCCFNAAPPKRKNAAPPKRKNAAPPKRKNAAPPKQKNAAPPKQKNAAPPKQKNAAPPKRKNAAPPKRKNAAPPKRKNAAPPKRKNAAPPKRKNAAPPKRKNAAPPKRKNAAPPKRKNAAPPKRKNAAPPKRKNAAPPKRKNAAPPKRKNAAPPKRKNAAPPKRKNLKPKLDSCCKSCLCGIPF
ncbi:titin-like [Lineus longissimus]|uniref:titin-like n=1 Tax=Lineus longissimus TaxID=88925 RepID=UPI00315C84E0